MSLTKTTVQDLNETKTILVLRIPGIVLRHFSLKRTVGTALNCVRVNCIDFMVRIQLLTALRPGSDSNISARSRVHINNVSSHGNKYRFGKSSLKHSMRFRLLLSNQETARALASAPRTLSRQHGAMRIRRVA